MLLSYASVAAFFVVAVGFMFGSLLFGRWLRPHRPDAEKLATYECGEEPIGQAWFNFNPRFYVIALIFIVFDVEVAFLYPVAVVFKRWVAAGRGAFALGEILLFIAVLLVGLAYVWVKGDLEWVRVMRERNPAASTRPARASTSRSGDGMLIEAHHSGPDHLAEVAGPAPEPIADAPAHQEG